MSRPVLEVADIFRDHGAAWRRANAGHVSLDQMKVMSAIERCRTAALGGHVARCEDCPHTVIAYNSCRNRHCPKCQGTAAKEWLAAREADLLPVLPGGFHRIRHYGLLASGSRAANIARARQMLAVPLRSEQQDTSQAQAADEPRMLPRPCPGCGGRMFIIETFARGSEPKHRPPRAPTEIRIDTS